MVATLHAEPGARPGVDNLILVSSDTHIGPLMSQLREYCPRQYLDDFDAFAAQMRAQGDPTGAGELREAMAHLSLEEKEALLAQFDDPNGPVAQYMRNRRTPGAPRHERPARRHGSRWPRVRDHLPRQPER